MSEIKALEKLRELLDVEIGEAEPYFKGEAICDEIEAEIADNYMRLPMDADGVPIHVGDVMCSAGIREKGHKVIVSAIFEDGFVEYGSDNGLIGPLRQEDWVHVKPRTLENIVADAIQYGHNGITGDRIEGKVAEFCAEIRELLGGDTE